MVRCPGQIRQRPEDGLERDGMLVDGLPSHIASDYQSQVTEEHMVSSTDSGAMLPGMNVMVLKRRKPRDATTTFLGEGCGSVRMS